MLRLDRSFYESGLAVDQSIDIIPNGSRRDCWLLKGGMCLCQLLKGGMCPGKRSRKPVVTGKEYVVDVTHLRSLNFDPAYVTPLNIAVKDTYEFVVERIVSHDFTNVNDKKWLVRWDGTDTPEETWENYDTLTNVHQHCAALQIDLFSPKKTFPGF